MYIHFSLTVTSASFSFLPFPSVFTHLKILLFLKELPADPTFLINYHPLSPALHRHEFSTLIVSTSLPSVRNSTHSNHFCPSHCMNLLIKLINKLLLLSPMNTSWFWSPSSMWHQEIPLHSSLLSFLAGLFWYDPLLLFFSPHWPLLCRLLYGILFLCVP